MADLKISQLSIATVAPALSYIPIASSGANWAIPATAAAIGAAPTANGVTNGDSHDHSGGDGGTIAYSSLSGLPTLGTAAGYNTGTSGATVPLLNAVNTWSAVQTIQSNMITTSDTQYAPIVQINAHHDSNAAGYVYFQKSRGTTASPADVSDADNIGTFIGNGYFNAAYRQAAFFAFSVDGAPSGSNISGKITFVTKDSSGNNNYFVFAGSGAASIGTNVQNASAKLQVDSTTRGFLPPRMTTTQRDAISSPAAGLVIYNSTTNKLQCYNGTIWNDLF